MGIEGIDLANLSKIISQQVEYSTCVECCKYYIAPETAECGHSLCHNCWSGRRSCPSCSLPLKRSLLKLNRPLQKLTCHVRSLAKAFEKLFNLKLEEFMLGSGELESENDPAKNMNDWLASSQNQFSAPPQSSEMSTQKLRQNSNCLEVSPSKIQVHSTTKRKFSPEKVVHKSAPQDDWDKIEIQAAEEVPKKVRNVIDTREIETIDLDDENEYSANNPRRSSRLKEYKNNANNNSPNKENKESSIDMDKTSNSAKQNWNNVKKMRKEYSKLNKNQRKKLNVSIEMCKKTQSSAKLNIAPPTTNINSPQVYEMSTQKLRQNSNCLEVSPSKIQVHSTTKRKFSPEKVVHKSAPQDDWDKIEIQAAEEVPKKVRNVIDTREIETIDLDDENEYSANNPRRSSRLKEYKNNANNNSPNKENKESSIDMDKTSNSAKQNWNNVKKMRKEYSQLNKNQRKKLNVSIEMCKKTQSSAKLNIAPPTTNINSPQGYEIDENTPKQLNTNSVNNFSGNELTKIIKSNHHTDIDETTNSKQTVKENLIAPYHTSNDYLSEQKSRNKKQLTVVQPQASIETSLQKNCREKDQIRHIPFYKKGALYTRPELEHQLEEKSTNTINRNTESNSNTNDYIEITIKVGNTIANIVIKQKNDIQMKFNSDRDIQTSLCAEEDETSNIVPLKVNTQNVSISVDSNSKINIEQKQTTQQNIKQIPTDVKSISVKKNTASADTGTGQFEITGSVEKELSNIMECAENEEQQATKSVQNILQLSSQIVSEQSKSVAKKTQKCSTAKPIAEPENIATLQNSATLQTNFIPEDVEYLNVNDIFESDNIQNGDVQLLKFSKNTTPSEVLKPTAHTKNKTQMNTEKRCRDADDENLPNSKKQKSNKTEISGEANKTADNAKQNKQNLTESEPMNSVMGKVFANIDADMKIIESQNIDNVKLDKANINDNLIQNKDTQKQNMTANYYSNAKDSENIFTVCVEKDDVIEESSVSKKDLANEPQLDAEDFLTPVFSRNHEKASADPVDNNVVNVSNYDSESIVEDTPQKESSVGRLKQNSNQSQMKSKESRMVSGGSGHSSTSTDMSNSNNVIVIETNPRTELETPLNINKFANHITPTSQNANTLSRSVGKTGYKKYCIAGSCLHSAELAMVKALCVQNKWTYVDKYTKDLTHLVVKVDEENKSQRTVKYLWALAARKWIVTFEWVEKCFRTKQVIGEENYEALDYTGDPGPRLSRVANTKLFQGITFYCMEPFNTMDTGTFKQILEESGGRVVNEAKEVCVTDSTSAPAILLAEPQNTQEDLLRFIDLAMQLSIVPVNYVWVLNCLGSYTLDSIQDLLLCPLSLLPKATSKWPEVLMSREDDSNT